MQERWKVCHQSACNGCAGVAEHAADRRRTGVATSPGCCCSCSDSVDIAASPAAAADRRPRCRSSVTAVTLPLPASRQCKAACTEQVQAIVLLRCCASHALITMQCMQQETTLFTSPPAGTADASRPARAATADAYGPHLTPPPPHTHTLHWCPDHA